MLRDILAPCGILGAYPRNVIQVHDAGGEGPIGLGQQRAFRHNAVRCRDNASAVEDQTAVVAAEKVGVGIHAGQTA